MVLVPFYESKPFQRFFVTDFSNFWFQENALILSIFELENVLFLNRSEFCQKKFGSVISDLMATKCDVWRNIWWTILFDLCPHTGPLCNEDKFKMRIIWKIKIQPKNSIITSCGWAVTSLNYDRVWVVRGVLFRLKIERFVYLSVELLMLKCLYVYLQMTRSASY